MTPISADELTFDDEGGGAIGADELAFDQPPAPKAKKAKPQQPQQPKKLTLSEMKDRAKTFKPLQDPAPGYDISLDREPGGVVLQFPRGDSFKPQGVTLAERGPGKIKPAITGVRREEGESLDSFLKRSEAWHKGEQTRKRGERAELAEVRAKTTPSRGPIGRVAEGLKTGLGEAIRTAGVGAKLVTGQEPDDVALEQPLPTMNEEDAKGWLNKGGQGLGSMIPFMLASAATGPMAVTLLGAAQNAGQTYEEARAKGVGHDEALAAAIPGALIGMLEGVGGGGGASHGLLKGIAGEAGQEGLSEVLNNINAKFISGYDPQRAITEGVFENAVLGGLLGAGVHGVGAALSGKPAAIPPPDVAHVQRANPSFISDPDVRQANLLAWHENANRQLKDTNGNPKILYHGTRIPSGQGIAEFDFQQINRPGNGYGFHFAESPELGSQYAYQHLKEGDGGHVIPVYLNIKNPARPSVYAAVSNEVHRQYKEKRKELSFREWSHFAEMKIREDLEARGYDGILHQSDGLQDGSNGGNVWVAFYPEQIKSATGNEGTFNPNDQRLSASFTSDQLLEMERRAAQAGRPVALRQVTKESFQQQIGAIQQELMRVDPTSPEFARLADRAVQLRRAVEEAPTPDELRDGKTMREWARKHNMWHDGATNEMLEMLGVTDESGTDTTVGGIRTNWDLFRRNVKRGDRGARFYPLPADNKKGGIVFLSPQSMVDAGIIQQDEVGEIGGMNVPVEMAVDQARMAELGGYQDVAATIRAAIEEANAKGLPKVSFAMYVPGQGLGKTRQLLRHESFHTGQQFAADAANPLTQDSWNNPMTLVSNQIVYHPTVARVAQMPGGQSVLAYYDGDPTALAFEMAAYAAAGQTAELGWTKEQADEYLADYLLDVLETSGIDALEGLERGARLSGPVAQQITNIKGEYNAREQQRRDRANAFAASLRAPSAAPGFEGGVGGSGGEGGEVGQGGVESGGDQDTTGATPGEETRDYGELDADELEWDEEDLVEMELTAAFDPRSVEPPVAPPVAPPDGPSPVPGKPGQPLTEEVLAKTRYEELRQQLLNKAVKGGYEYDPLVPPGIQLAQAIEKGHLDLDSIAEEMAKSGMSVNDLANLAEFTQHRAGQILNELSQLSKTVRDLIQTNPVAATAIVGPNKVMQEGLKILERTELGHSMWERMGNVMRKNFLSRLSTTFTQVWSTTGQIPMDIASGAIAGLAMRRLNPAKWQGNAQGMLAKAKEDVTRGVLPIITLAKGMNPQQVGDLVKLQTPSQQAQYRQMVDDLSVLHPELYGKLHGREDLAQSTPGLMSPAQLKQVLPMIQDPAKKREFEVRLRKLEGREKINNSIAGKIFKGYEKTLDLVLWPLSVQEYAFRRPMFIGALQRELEARGHDLNSFIADPSTVVGAKDILQSAVDEALRFTWAYEPKEGNKAVGQTEQALEGAASHFVKFWNKLGPIGATLEAFPRALTNGLKFAYEWSPFGFVSPAWQVQDKLRHGARDQITFQEAQRMSQAVVGTAMYAVALGLREWAGGEEWWQLKTGKKNKDGKPVYFDARRIPQLAFFLNAADLAKRANEDTLGDIKVEQRLKDTYLGARRNSQPGDLGAIDQFMLMWAGDTVPTNAKQRSQMAVGQWGSTFVIPLSNIRDAWAQFNEQEGAKRDLRDRPFLGPSLDKLPWLRRRLPLAEGPFEPSPQGMAYAPIAEGEGVDPVTSAFALGGAIGVTKMTPGQSFAAREFARLGLSPYTWLKRDPDPAIDRAQWKRMTIILQAVGQSLANSDSYRNQSPDQQRAIWEGILGGPDGAAAEAKAAGLESNPREADRRKTLQALPPYQRKAIGLDKKLAPVQQP